MLNLFSILDTKESRFVFMKGLIRIAKADGIIAQEELVFFDNLGRTMCIDEYLMNELHDIINSDKICSVEFEKREHKLAFLIESLQLCYIDGECSENEKKEISKIATELGVSFNTVNEIEKWVIEGMEWSNKVNYLFTLE